MIKKITLPLIIVLLVLVVNVQAFNYDITYYNASDNGLNVFTDPVSFKSDQADSIILTQDLNFVFNVSSPPNSYTATYESPFSTTFGISSGSLSQNFSCLNIGSASKEYTQNNVEGRNTMTHDGRSSSFISTSNRYQVTNSDRYMIVSSVIGSDSDGYAYNLFYDWDTGAGVPSEVDITSKLDDDNFKECTVMEVRRTGFPNADGNVAANFQAFAYIVFNSTAGNTSIHARFFNTGAFSARFVLYPLDEPGTIIDSQLSAGPQPAWTESNLNLEPTRLYVLAGGVENSNAATIQTPMFNVTIDTGLADYECIEDSTTFPCSNQFVCYSECDESTGTQTRTCTDANGLQPDLIEIRTCDIVILQNATLGFEEFETITDIKKCIPTFLTGCSYTSPPSDISVDRPINWTVIEDVTFKQNFLSMSDDWATEGSRSVKLWYIPPSEDGNPLPGTPSASCGELDQGIIPQIFQGVNDSTFLSLNVTFPATNMAMSFDTKRCNNATLKHGALRTLFDFVTLCPEQCYGINCSLEPNGRYIFNIFDTNTSTSILGTPFYGDSRLITTTPIFDLSDLGIVPGRTYNIIFAVSPPNNNFNDDKANCVLFDNVQYQVIQDPLTALVGDDCRSRCEGTDLLNARILPNGNCLVIREEFSPSCLDDAEAESVENLEDFCVDDTTAALFNEGTAKYEEFDCDFRCQDGRCVTAEEFEEETTTPIESQTLLLEIIGFLLTRMFWALTITGIVFAAGLITTAKVSDTPSWEGAGLIAMLPLVFFIAVEWLPLEVGAIIILPIALMIVNLFNKAR